MLYSAAAKPSVKTGTLNSYPDASSVSDWAQKAGQQHLLFSLKEDIEKEFRIKRSSKHKFLFTDSTRFGLI